MTIQRFDEHSTEFGLWLRKQPEIDSKLGFVTTNVDFFWKNYKTGKFMLIEEKRFMSQPKTYQHYIFKQLDEAFEGDSNYCGFFLLQFEKTSPDDGKIYLDKNEITTQQLIDFLTFNWPSSSPGETKSSAGL